MYYTVRTSLRLVTRFYSQKKKKRKKHLPVKKTPYDFGEKQTKTLKKFVCYESSFVFKFKSIHSRSEKSYHPISDLHDWLNVV